MRMFSHFYFPSRRRLTTVLSMLAVGEKNQLKIEKLELGPCQVFLLTRLVTNLKGSEVTGLIEAIPHGGNNAQHYSQEKQGAMMELEDVKLTMEE